MALDPEARQWLRRLVGAKVRFDEPMAQHTWLKVGGPAEALITASERQVLQQLVRGAAQRRLPLRVVGAGSNLLVKDRGLRGLVIALKQGPERVHEIERGPEQSLVAVAAGITTRRLCAYALSRGLAGMNFALGIPGSIGGAICMNAGTTGGAMADVLIALIGMTPAGDVVRVDRRQLGFGYRRLDWPAPYPAEGMIVLEGVFALTPGDAAQLKQQARKLLCQRRQRQPLGVASAGCFFKNPSADQPAGLLIDQAGLKGKQIGDALVSRKHANFIVNRGRATATHILALMEHVQATVGAKFNVLLEPEVQIIGE